MWCAARPAPARAVFWPTSVVMIRLIFFLSLILLCFGILDCLLRFSGKTAAIHDDSFLLTMDMGRKVTQYFEVDLDVYTNSWSSFIVDAGAALLIAALWPSLCKVLFRLVPEKNGGYNRLGLLSALGLPLLVLCLLLLTKEEHVIVSNGLTQPAYQVSNRHGGILLKSDQPPDLAHGVLAVIAHGIIVHDTTRFNGRVDVNVTHIRCVSQRGHIVGATAHPFLMELRSVCQELVGNDDQLSLYSVETVEQGVHIDLATLGAHASTSSSPKEVYLDPNLISTSESSPDSRLESDNLRCASSTEKGGQPAAYCLSGPPMRTFSSSLLPNPTDSDSFTALIVEKALQTALNSTEIHERHMKIDQYTHSWRMGGVLLLIVVTFLVRGIVNPGPKVESLGQSYDRGFESENEMIENSVAPFEDPTVGVWACVVALLLVWISFIPLKESTTSPVGFLPMTFSDIMMSWIAAASFLLYDREYRIMLLNISICRGQGADLSSVAEAASPASHSKSLISRFVVFAFSVLFLSAFYSDAAVLSPPEITTSTTASGNSAASTLKKGPTEFATLGGETGDQRKLGGIWYGNRNLLSGAGCWQLGDLNEKKYYFAIFAPKIHTSGPGIWWDTAQHVGLVATSSLVQQKNIGRCSTLIGDTLSKLELPEYPTDSQAIEVLVNATSVPDFPEGLGMEELKMACAVAACNKRDRDGKEGRPDGIELPGAKLKRSNWLALSVLVVVLVLGGNLKFPPQYIEFPIPLSTLAMERLGKRDKARVAPQRGGAPNPRGLMSVLGVLEGNRAHYGLTVSPTATSPATVVREGVSIQKNPQDP